MVHRLDEQQLDAAAGPSGKALEALPSSAGLLRLAHRLVRDWGGSVGVAGPTVLSRVPGAP
jgi:hypothetical protein